MRLIKYSRYPVVFLLGLFSLNMSSISQAGIQDRPLLSSQPVILVVPAPELPNQNSFLVASNTAFEIFAEVKSAHNPKTGEELSLESIKFDFQYFLGAKAQDPAIGGSGILLSSKKGSAVLSDLTHGGKKIFSGGQRTAKTSGNLSEQAVRFEMRMYTANGEEVDADVLYSIYKL